MFGRKRKGRTEPTVLARPVTIGDGADKHGAMAAYVERPGQFTALDHSAATRAVGHADERDFAPQPRG